MPERIKDVNVLEQHNLDMQRYGLYISRFRSLPEYKDGLKPVQRRILYAMFNDVKAIGNNRAKCAKIVGAVIGSYNPHGDAACYDAMSSLVNWFETKIPLLNQQGTFGSVQGDKAAAMRYTEASLNKFTMDCIFGDLQETAQVVNWSRTYDNKLWEPDYLPVKIPLLLVNGSFGIALGFRVYIPRHNLAEVIDATVKLIDNPKAEVVLVPDPSMPCEIFDTDWKAISNKGRGAYKVRGIIDIENYKGYNALVIKSLPDQVFLDAVIEDIEKLVVSKKLVQIHDMLDETQHDILRYIIVLKKGTDPNYVREVIYKSTCMTKTFSVNFEVLDGINPIRLSYKAYLEMFIRFRAYTKFRLYCNKSQILRTKIHERELYIKVLESGEIDTIIKKIKSQKTIDDNSLIEYLIKKLHMTDLQAKFIINSSLSKLSMAYLNKYKTEAAEMQKRVDEYTRYTIDENLILADIKQELLHFKEVYGQKRTSRIIKKHDSEIPQGEFKIVITENNFIKKLQPNDNINTKNGATPKYVLNIDNTDSLLILDEMGKIFKLPVHLIPFTERASGGIDIRMIIKKLTSNIICLMKESDLKEKAEYINKYYAIIATQNGYIKRLDLQDFITAPPSGVMFIKLDAGDKVKDVCISNNSNDIVIYSNTHALRIPLEDVPYLKRNTKGLMSMRSEDTIDGITLISKLCNSDIIVVTQNGKVNRFNQLALPLSNRGKRGNKVIKLGKDDKIIGLYSVNEDTDSLRSISAKAGQLIIPVKDIPEGSSISPGTKLFSTRGDTILNISIIR